MFDGTCEEAFRFYQQLLGGTLQTMLTYGDSAMANQTPEHLRKRILHATLVGDTCELLGADVMPQDYQRPAGYAVVLSLAGIDRAREIFTQLSAGGEVRFAFEPTFWSPGFGFVVDRFGTPWEVNCEAATG
jgi:PhnB protein